MSYFRKYLIIGFLAIMAICASAAPTVWEEVDRMPGIEFTQHFDGNDNVVATVDDGYVYVTVQERSTVTVYTILGQPVVQEELNPGVYRFRVKSRGIYVIKADNYTLRVKI